MGQFFITSEREVLSFQLLYRSLAADIQVRFFTDGSVTSIRIKILSFGSVNIVLTFALYYINRSYLYGLEDPQPEEMDAVACVSAF